MTYIFIDLRNMQEIGRHKFTEEQEWTPDLISRFNGRKMELLSEEKSVPADEIICELLTNELQSI